MKRQISLLLAAAFLLSALPVSACAGGPEAAFRGYVALTFDDGPSGEITESLLDMLAAQEVNATFFVCGYRVDQYPETLVRAVQQGHEIGLHSCCHSYMHRMSYDEVTQDVTDCMQSVAECCGVRPRLFRPPGGLYSSALTEASRDLALSVVLWSVDPRDWDLNNRTDIVQSVLDTVKPGSIILMHDLYPRSVRAAGQIIDRLRAQGYAFCTVSELATYYGQTMQPGGVYSDFTP